MNNKLLKLTVTHILMCALSMSEESNIVISSEQGYSSLHIKESIGTEIKNSPSIQSYILINNRYFISLLAALALYKNFYSTTKEYSSLVAISLVVFISILVLMIFLHKGVQCNAYNVNNTISKRINVFQCFECPFSCFSFLFDKPTEEEMKRRRENARGARRRA